ALPRCSELDNYCRQLSEQHRGSASYILCTQNYAEGKFIAFDREIDMWCEIVRTHCARGATIFHKSHPAEVLPRGEALAGQLRKDYRFVQLDNRFRRFPIEIWRHLLLTATVVSGSNPIL